MIKVCVLLLVLSVVLGGISFFAYDHNTALLKHGISTTARVVRLEFEADTSSSSRGGVYYPVIAFDTTTGQHIEQKSSYGSSPPSYKSGQEVKIFYQEGNPKEWIIDNWLEIYMLPVIFGVFSALCFLATILTWLGNRMSRNKKALNYTSDRL